MNYKNSSLLVVVIILVGISGYGIYLNNQAKTDIKDLQQQAEALKKDNDQLVKENKQAKEDTKKSNDKLKEIEKKIKELTSVEKKVTDTNSGQSQGYLPANTYFITEEAKAALDAKVKAEIEQRDKEEAEKKAKENEPQYAVYEGGTDFRFFSDNGITQSQFEELNPGVEKIERGQSYRIK